MCNNSQAPSFPARRQVREKAGVATLWHLRMLKEAARRLLIMRTPLRRYYRFGYIYMFSPSELLFLCRCVQETASLAGPVGEIGCYRGTTAMFLGLYMDEIGHSNMYYAYDTFSGFTRGDIDYEIDHRGKAAQRFSMRSAFRINEKAWVDESLRERGIHKVRTVRADASQHDFAELSGASFCLIDVDLYRPVRAAIARVHDVAAPGAIILVDDCREEEKEFDAAYSAYCDFVDERGYARSVVHGRFGFIRKR